mgnify:FL=1
MLPLLTKLDQIPLDKSIVKNLPIGAGIYIFLQKDIALYIGKAKNLKNRVGSYFTSVIELKTKRMLGESSSMSFIRVNSELESLLLEAFLIRKYQPKYNSQAKDDKHPLYIKITKEKYPRVLTARKAEESGHKGIKNLAFFGPFPSSTNVYSVLKMLRRIFPYSEHKLGKRGCLYSQIGLCSPCPNEIEKIKDIVTKQASRDKYIENIKMIKLVLSSRISKVMKNLKKRMRNAAKEEKFEKATRIRRQIERLIYITQPIIPKEDFLENPNLYDDIR